jgi:hypothetical protein
MSTDLKIKPQGSSQSERTIKNVNIESYNCEPVLAEDNMTPVGARYQISGTAILDAEDWADIDASLSGNSTRLEYAKMPNPSVPSSLLIDLSRQESDIGGPFIKITATQVVGSAVALVRFDISDQRSLCANQPVVSHVWTQTMAVDQVGRLTRTINGQMRVSRASQTTSVELAATNSWNTRRPWADLYRAAILPALPAYGWRRESQQFAYDITSTVLTYQVIDKQYLHDLPDGVRVGDMEFSYERTAQDAGIGTCQVVVELEGDQDLNGRANGFGNRYLVKAAVELSKARINASYRSILVTRMRVTERQILSGFSIRFELEAQTFPASASASAALVPLAFMVGQYFTVQRSTSRTISPYGSFVPFIIGDDVTNVSYYMLPHWLEDATSDTKLNGMNCDGKTVDMPVADIVTLTKANTYGDVTVIVTANAEGVPEMNQPFDGRYESSSVQTANNSDGYTQVVAHTVSLANVNARSNISRLSVMYTQGADVVIQTRKPEVRVRERLEICQANKAPARVMRPMPSGAILMHEDWNVTFGKFDAQGQRMFTGVYEREVMMYDAGGAQSANGFYAITSGPLVSARGWKAPNDAVVAPLSPLGTDASQVTTASIFVPFTNASFTDANYGVPAQAYAT